MYIISHKRSHKNEPLYETYIYLLKFMQYTFPSQPILEAICSNKIGINWIFPITHKIYLCRVVYSENYINDYFYGSMSL